ncbi:MAG: class I SAM-dependent methyltransferase [Proteobacteria bacterium]|nr:class I SAM-dependent methyltransferase [Pseudomonadota bacterium]
MSKKIFLTLCAVFAIQGQGATVRASECQTELDLSTYMQRYVAPWIDPRGTFEHAAGIAKLCLDEPAQERITPVVSGGAAYSYLVDPGYSFGQVDGALLDALISVRRTYEARRASYLAQDPSLTPFDLDAVCRVRVLDLGAGHGFAAWKFILAGAHVTLVEPHSGLLDEGINLPLATLGKARRFLPVPLENVTHIVKADAASFLNQADRKGSFDGVYASRVFDYMSVDEAQVCANLIPSVMKEGASLWVRTFSGFIPEADGRDADIYRQQLAKDMPFPGFMMMSMGTRVSENSLCALEFFSQEGQICLPPRNIFGGSYAPLSSASCPQTQAVLRARYFDQRVLWRHRSLFIFDPVSVMKLFDWLPLVSQGLFFEASHGLQGVTRAHMTFAQNGTGAPGHLYFKAMRSGGVFNAQESLHAKEQELRQRQPHVPQIVDPQTSELNKTLASLEFLRI